MPNRSLIWLVWVTNGKRALLRPFAGLFLGNEVRCRLGRPFSTDEVVWGPRAAHDDLNTGQMAGRHVIAVLVFLNFFVVNQMGDINQHAPGIDFAATNVLVKRGENFVDLDGKSAGFGLSLTLPDSLFPEFAQVFTANGGRKFDFFQGFTQRAVFNKELQVHFRFAFKLGHAFQESLAIDADGATKRFIGIKYGSKTERQDSGAFKALADHMGML
jgi:hypothetical protein